jgi:hypothetical protein
MNSLFPTDGFNREYIGFAVSLIIDELFVFIIFFYGVTVVGFLKRLGDLSSNYFAIFHSEVSIWIRV